MGISAISNNSSDIQAYLMSGLNASGRSNNSNDTNNAEYAKKGEPMYMADMDADGDGVVTLDEYRNYCKEKGIGAKQMVKMSQMAASYRTMKAENEAIDNISKLIPNASPKVKQTNNESVYARQGEPKYNISMDANNDKVVTYKEYMTYCRQNASTHELKANTSFEESNDGKLNIKSTGKAIESYESKENHALESTFEEVV